MENWDQEHYKIKKIWLNSALLLKAGQRSSTSGALLLISYSVFQAKDGKLFKRRNQQSDLRIPGLHYVELPSMTPRTCLKATRSAVWLQCGRAPPQNGPAR